MLHTHTPGNLLDALKDAILLDATDYEVAELADRLTAGELLAGLTGTELARAITAMSHTADHLEHILRVHGGPCPHGGCDSCDM